MFDSRNLNPVQLLRTEAKYSPVVRIFSEYMQPFDPLRLGSPETFEAKLEQAQHDLGIPTVDYVPVQFLRHGGTGLCRALRWTLIAYLGGRASHFQKKWHREFL